MNRYRDGCEITSFRDDLPQTVSWGSYGQNQEPKKRDSQQLSRHQEEENWDEECLCYDYDINYVDDVGGFFNRTI